MKKLFKRLFRFFIYCLGYVLVINFMASAINDSLDEFNLDEALSVKGMKAGQKDILVAARIKIENIDLQSIQDKAIKKMKDWEQIAE